MKSILTIWVLLFSIWGTTVHAQTPAYLHYGVEEGLPSSLVYCAIQDKKGFMWFGTDNGLARFDGVRFKVYGIEDGLPDPEVLELFEDSHGRLWISCFQKNPCYIKAGKIFTDKNNSLLKKISIKTAKNLFFEDKDENVWITGKGFNICCLKSQEVECYNSVNDLQVVSTLSVVELENKKFVYGYSSIYDYSNPLYPVMIYVNELNTTPILPYSYFHKKAFYYLKGNNLIKTLIGAQGIEEVRKNYNLPNRQNKISFFNNESMWVCYPPSLDGAFKVDLTASDKNRQVENFLNGKKVSDVFNDQEKNIWFTTLNDGLFAMHQEKTMIYSSSNSPELNSHNITAVALLTEDRVLIGNEAGDIFMLAKGRLTKISFKKKIAANRVRQIIQLPENGWVAVMDNFLYSEKNEEIDIKYTLQSPDNKSIFSAPKYLFHDMRKTWIAHAKGLCYWDNLEVMPKVVIKGKRITAVGNDNENNIWSGGMDGLLSEKDSFQINWGERFKEVGGRIIDIKQGNKNQLWIATAEYGLLKVHVKNGEVKSIEVVNDALKDKINGIKSLFKSEKGNIWLATNSGIYELDNDLNVRHFDTSDGLPSNDVNALTIDQDTLWAATVSGLAKVQLNQNDNDSNFSTYISGIQYDLDGKAVSIDLINYLGKYIQIPPGASMIDIQLSGLHFSSGGNISYEYVVEENLLPLKWITWSNLSRSIAHKIFSDSDTLMIKDHHRNFGANTPAGCFKTKVTAISKNGIVSAFPDEFLLSILPQWYETIWFNFLVVGMIGFIFWRFYQQQTAMKRFERAASELQLQAIKAQINPHFIGNSINAIQQFFYPPDPIKASQYISTFTSLLRQTMHLSEVPFISFGKELIFIEDYLKMVKLRFGDRFEYEITGADAIPNETPFPAMILQPIIENGTIHGLAPEGLSKLEMDFKIEGNLLFCTISDNGVGIEASKAIRKNQNIKRISKGIGLLKKKIEVINKMYGINMKIDFTDLSTLGNSTQGTKVTMTFSPEKITRGLVDKD